MARNLKPATGYVEPSVIEALKKQASDEHRSLSSLVALILTKYVQESTEQNKLAKQDSPKTKTKQAVTDGDA